MPNPYVEVHRLQRAHQGRRWTWLLPLLATVVATPLARPVLLGFLDRGPAALPPGVEAIAFRVGAVIAAALALHTFSDLVRGPDRAVLDVHPVQPRLLLAAIARRTAASRSYLPAMGAILMSPLVVAGHLDAWLGATGLAIGAWVAGLGVGFATHLAAAEAARSERLALLLDLLRGDNPRMQAALIYAPGVALAITGVAVGLAASGLSGALQGWATGWGFLLLPPALGVAGWAVALPLSERAYVRTSALLAEIDAAWAGVEEGDDERQVYLEWLARRRPELLRALRQGWRRLRTWPMGAWGLGAVGAFAGWSPDEGAAASVLAVTGAAVAVISAIPGRLAEGDPAWLDDALGVNPVRVGAARATVAWLYGQGAILPATGALAIRHGGDVVAVFGAVELFAALTAGAAAAAAARWRGRSTWVYAPLALVAWAGLAGLGWQGVPT